MHAKCVVHFRNALRKSGCLTDTERRTIASCAARSTCGKDTVLCCHYIVGTCSDPAPGDMMKGGFCGNDATLAACDRAADCTTSSSRITRDATSCMADGGVVVDGGGSVCTPCPTTTTTTTTLASTTTTTL